MAHLFSSPESRDDRITKNILFRAVENGDLKHIQYFLKQDQKKHKELLRNLRNSTGRSLLHIAALHGHLELVTYLFQELGVDLQSRDAQGDTALLLAAKYEPSAKCQHWKIVNFLLENKADPKDVNNAGFTFVRYVIEYGRRELLMSLIANNAISVESPNPKGNTCLHLAAHFSQFYIVLDLLKANASVHSKNQKNQKPIDLSKDERITKELRKAENSKTQKQFLAVLQEQEAKELEEKKRKDELERELQKQNELETKRLIELEEARQKEREQKEAEIRAEKERARAEQLKRWEEETKRWEEERKRRQEEARLEFLRREEAERQKALERIRQQEAEAKALEEQRVATQRALEEKIKAEKALEEKRQAEALQWMIKTVIVEEHKTKEEQAIQSPFAVAASKTREEREAEIKRSYDATQEWCIKNGVKSSSLTFKEHLQAELKRQDDDVKWYAEERKRQLEEVAQPELERDDFIKLCLELDNTKLDVFEIETFFKIFGACNSDAISLQGLGRIPDKFTKEQTNPIYKYAKYNLIETKYARNSIIQALCILAKAGGECNFIRLMVALQNDLDKANIPLLKFLLKQDPKFFELCGKLLLISSIFIKRKTFIS